MFLELVKVAPPNVRNYTFADVNKALQLGQAAMAVQWASGAKPLEDASKSSVAGKLGYMVPRRGRGTRRCEACGPSPSPRTRPIKRRPGNLPTG